MTVLTKIGFQSYLIIGSTDIVLDRATRYGLHGPQFKPRCRIHIPHPFRPKMTPSTSSLLYSGYRVFLGGKATEGGINYPTPSSAEVMNG
jgi:hypothetical protein